MDPRINKPSIGDVLGKAAIAATFAAGALLVAGFTDGVPPIVSQALAAPVGTDVTYLPSRFPTPEGEAAPVIESF